MNELQEQSKAKPQRAIDSLPLWMRQMLEDKVQRCLQAEAEERAHSEGNQIKDFAHEEKYVSDSQ